MRLIHKSIVYQISSIRLLGYYYHDPLLWVDLDHLLYQVLNVVREPGGGCELALPHLVQEMGHVLMVKRQGSLQRVRVRG